MEPPKAEIVHHLHTDETTMRYVINSKVANIEEHKVPCYISGFGDTALFHEVSRGWFLYLEGSHEALHVGMEKPELVKGDRVRITLEKVI